MERKVALIEQRLNLVEQFVETRFCESYQDFVVRSSTNTCSSSAKRGAKKEDDSLELLVTFLGQRFCESFREFTVQRLSSSQSFDKGGAGVTSETTTPINSNTPLPSTSSTFTPLRPTTRSSTTTVRELRIKVVRLEDIQEQTCSSTPSKTDKITNSNHDTSASQDKDDFQSQPPSPLPSDPGSNIQDNCEETSRGEVVVDQDDNQEDSYFTFPLEEKVQVELDGDGAEGVNGGIEEDNNLLDTSANDPDNQNWSEATSDDSDYEISRPKKKACIPKRKKDDRERPFKCGYPPCVKSFISKKNLKEHERVHEKDKWVACRVKSCKRPCLDNSKRLVHERKCILKNLKEGNRVNPKLIEDVRRRSRKLKEDPFKDFKKMLPELVEKEEGPKRRKKEPSFKYDPDMEQEIVNGNMKICPFCKRHWHVEVYENHLKSHVKERTINCRFCGKGFLSRQVRNAHEKLHEKDKYAMRCRVGGEDVEEDGQAWCTTSFTTRSKLTAHERRCIRRALEKGREVNREVMEDVRKRSVGVILNWPGYDIGVEEVGRVKVCFVCKKWKGEGKDYEEHMEGHKDWKCGKCGMKFVSKRDLVRHVHRKHTEKQKKRKDELEDDDEEEEEMREESSSTGERENAMGEPEEGMGEPEEGMGEPEEGMGEPEEGMGEPENGMMEHEKGIEGPEEGTSKKKVELGENVGSQVNNDFVSTQEIVE